MKLPSSATSGGQQGNTVDLFIRFKHGQNCYIHEVKRRTEIPFIVEASLA
jgi:hypothetical protein